MVGVQNRGFGKLSDSALIVGVQDRRFGKLPDVICIHIWGMIKTYDNIVKYSSCTLPKSEILTKDIIICAQCIIWFPFLLTLIQRWMVEERGVEIESEDFTANEWDSVLCLLVGCSYDRGKYRFGKTLGNLVSGFTNTKQDSGKTPDNTPGFLLLGLLIGLSRLCVKRKLGNTFGNIVAGFTCVQLQSGKTLDNIFGFLYTLTGWLVLCSKTKSGKSPDNFELFLCLVMCSFGCSCCKKFKIPSGKVRRVLKRAVVYCAQIIMVGSAIVGLGDHMFHFSLFILVYE